jgi:6-pyruvoyltetrahydropterin/6-carboxytetrahydropterin synthase
VRAELTRSKPFEASHRYWRAGWDAAENRAHFGAEASRWGHGHNYVLEVTLAGPVDPDTGMVVNIKDLDAAMATVVRGVDHKFLNEEYAPLGERVPAPEVLAGLLWADLLPYVRAWPGVALARVRLVEGEGTWADCEGGERVYLTRAYTFSAAHRLHSAALDEATNLAVFGKCNNPHGHGHDYRLEVTLRGEPDARTGRVFDPNVLDRIVGEEILAAWDHRHLNEEAPPFDRLVPTSENVVRVAWERLAPHLEGRLARLVLHETARSAFTYEGD